MSVANFSHAARSLTSKTKYPSFMSAFVMSRVRQMKKSVFLSPSKTPPALRAGFSGLLA
jgi:hypothetical protein